MSTEKKSFFGVMKSYNKNFRVASIMELFEVGLGMDYLPF